MTIACYCGTVYTTLWGDSRCPSCLEPVINPSAAWDQLADQILSEGEGQ